VAGAPLPAMPDPALAPTPSIFYFHEPLFSSQMMPTLLILFQNGLDTAFDGASIFKRC
jgi:hypothetical protein